VDAPSHYSATGATIDQRGLDLFVGPCQVIRVAVAQRGVVAPEAIRAEMTEPRVLMATGTYSNPREFSADFAALSPKLIGWLRRQGVLLVGVDTPSVDPAASKDLPAHRACLEHDVTILEGIVLDHVPEGSYELIALPLRLVGFDASPVRAVLRTL
jgi:arylformamidase